MWIPHTQKLSALAFEREEEVEGQEFILNTQQQICYKIWQAC
jgi:hypothetical protein